MNRLRILKGFVICLALAVIISGTFSTAVSAEENTSLLVKLVAGLSQDEQEAVIAEDGGSQTSVIAALRLHVVSVDAADVEQVLSNYQSDPRVESAEISQTRKVEAVPSDESYGAQWALPQVGWDLVYGLVAPIVIDPIKVAVLDTGVDASHPDLAGNVSGGTSVIDATDGTVDVNGHGTALAGIVAAVTDNDLGIAGVGFSGVQVMPVKVISDDGTGQDADIINGIVYAVDHGASVILMGFSNPGFSQNLQDAIDYAWAQGVVIVAATGNDGISDPTYPAGDRGVIGVSATDSTDALAVFSNYGTDTFLAAPGVDIVATGLNYVTYPSITGTSASAAIVAGVAAFMKAADPGATNGMIAYRLAANADPAGAVEETGNGRVNMARAVADTSTSEIEPIGDPSGGPYVGPYVITAFSLTLNPNSGAAGATVAVTSGGSGFTGGATVTVKFDGTTVVTCSANNGGNIQVGSCSFTVPSAGAGPYTVSATDGTHAISTTFTVTGKLSQAITITQDAPVTKEYNQSFTLTATGGGSDNQIDFAVVAGSVCQITGTTSTSATVKMTSGTGTCQLTLNQAGNDNYNAAPQVTSAQTTATKADQAALDLTVPTSITYGNTGTASTTGGSGTGAVTYSAGGSGGCSVDSTTGDITVLNASLTCTISASKAGDDNYNGPVTDGPKAVTLLKAGQAITITQDAPVTKEYNQSFTLTATGGGSDNQIDFAVVAGSVCQITGTTSTSATVKMTSGTGTCQLTLNQAGNDNYNAAPQVTSAQTTATKADQAALTLNTSSPLTYSQSETMSVTGGTTNGAVTYNLVSGPCSVSDDQLTANSGTGSCSVNATMAGNDNYNAVTSSPDNTVNLQKASLTCTADSQEVQYSDPVADFTVTCGDFVNGEDQSDLGGTLACETTATIDSGKVQSEPKDYGIKCSGLTSDNYDITFEDGTLTVSQEDAEISYGTDNPTAAQVTAAGSGVSEPFTLSVDVSELLPDAGCPSGSSCPGDIGKAKVTITLTPIGPGSPINVKCTPGSVTGSGYDAVLPASCNFSGVPVNTYSVDVTVDGYYTGTYESVFTVYDPSLGFTTGGGWFYWPGTEDLTSGYPGDKTNFGYTMKYNKKMTNLQGNILVIRHLSDGSIYRMKSNSLGNLALGTNSNTTPYGWATFNGKATYFDSSLSDASPIGNYTFTVYVEDNNEPGTGMDNFWMECKDSDGTVLDDMSLSKAPSPAANAMGLFGGNIVVPHVKGKY